MAIGIRLAAPVRRLLLSLPCCVAAVLPAAAQSTPAATPRFLGRIIGVYDERTGNPIDSAEVRDMGTGSSALTTSTGTISLFFVDTAGGLLRIRKLGYSPLTLFVDNAPDLAPLTLTLEPLAQRLPTVLTTDSAPKYASPQLRGFEERRKTGFGTFIPEAVLRKEENRPFANVIRAHVPSLRVIETIDGALRVQIAVSGRAQQGGAPCPVDIYVDGVPLSITQASGSSTIIPMKRRVDEARRPSGTNDLNQFQVNNLAAVEFHNTATMPVEYNRTGSACGALFVWTRER